MFKNYFKSAYRYIKKNKFFSSINIVGLSAGLAVCFLIITFVLDEFSYDKFNEKGDRIFRIESDIQINGNGINGTRVPIPMAFTMVKDFPQIETAVRIRKEQSMLVKKGNGNILESSIVIADPSLFDVFTFPMIAGSAAKALTEPNSMVISESTAKKYFNSTDVVGKTLLVDDTANWKITGVMKDIPQGAHFHFDFIKSMPPEIKNRNGTWLNPWTATYLLAKPGVSLKEIDKMLAEIVSRYVGPQLEQMNPNSSGDIAKNGNFFRYYSRPLNKIHLFSNVSGEFEPNGNIQTVYIFIIIAMLILVMACVNFMNLSTAFSSRRSVEVGVRKVLGGLRKNLVAQFLLESIIISCIATFLAILFAILLLPYFNEVTGKNISAAVFFKSWMIISYLLLALFVGLVAGSYPAFYLSAFKPVRVLKEFLATGSRSGWLRNSLVVFQFVIANILVVGTLVVYKQFNYIRERDLGYNRNQILTIANTYKLVHPKTFKDEVERLPGVTGGTMTSNLPNHNNGGARAYFKDESAKPGETFLLGSWTVETNYIPLLDMKIIQGRNFSPDMPTDSSCVLINETAARLLGYSKDPINKAIYFHDSNPEGGFKILGVVKDFNAATLHDKIEPIVFHLGENDGAISFRVDTKNVPRLISLIKEKYQSMDKLGEEPFTYSFLNDDFNNLYKSDERAGKLYISFTLFAIVIACLGLFGLVAYASEQRIKEIGIRKVLGASTNNVIRLLSKDFLTLIVIAIAIACPLAFWGSYKWLQDFAYRTSIGIWVFLIAAFLTLAITMIIIFFQSVKVAVINPAKILRSK